MDRYTERRNTMYLKLKIVLCVVFMHTITLINIQAMPGVGEQPLTQHTVPGDILEQTQKPDNPWWKRPRILLPVAATTVATLLLVGYSIGGEQKTLDNNSSSSSPDVRVLSDKLLKSEEVNKTLFVKLQEIANDDSIKGKGRLFAQALPERLSDLRAAFPKISDRQFQEIAQLEDVKKRLPASSEGQTQEEVLKAAQAKKEEARAAFASARAAAVEALGNLKILRNQNQGAFPASISIADLEAQLSKIEIGEDSAGTQARLVDVAQLLQQKLQEAQAACILLPELKQAFIREYEAACEKMKSDRLFFIKDDLVHTDFTALKDVNNDTLVTREKLLKASAALGELLKKGMKARADYDQLVERGQAVAAKAPHFKVDKLITEPAATHTQLETFTAFIATLEKPLKDAEEAISAAEKVKATAATKLAKDTEALRIKLQEAKELFARIKKDEVDGLKAPVGQEKCDYATLKACLDELALNTEKATTQELVTAAQAQAIDLVNKLQDAERRCASVDELVQTVTAALDALKRDFPFMTDKVQQLTDKVTQDKGQPAQLQAHYATIAALRQEAQQAQEAFNALVKRAETLNKALPEYQHHKIAEFISQAKVGAIASFDLYKKHSDAFDAAIKRVDDASQQKKPATEKEGLSQEALLQARTAYTNAQKNAPLLGVTLDTVTVEKGTEKAYEAAIDAAIAKFKSTILIHLCTDQDQRCKNLRSKLILESGDSLRAELKKLIQALIDKVPEYIVAPEVSKALATLEDAAKTDYERLKAAVTFFKNAQPEPVKRFLDQTVSDEQLKLLNTSDFKCFVGHADGLKALAKYMIEHPEDNRVERLEPRVVKAIVANFASLGVGINKFLFKKMFQKKLS